VDVAGAVDVRVLRQRRPHLGDRLPGAPEHLPRAVQLRAVRRADGVGAGADDLSREHQGLVPGGVPRVQDRASLLADGVELGHGEGRGTEGGGYWVLGIRPRSGLLPGDTLLIITSAA